MVALTTEYALIFKQAIKNEVDTCVYKKKKN